MRSLPICFVGNIAESTEVGTPTGTNQGGQITSYAKNIMILNMSDVFSVRDWQVIYILNVRWRYVNSAKNTTILTLFSNELIN